MSRRITTIITAAIIAVDMIAATPDSTALYHEPYRPQYHFTPAHRWIGDPCGNIQHDGHYTAYSWGAATSPDLIHWTELNNHAINGVPEGIATFTGSVVVDSLGTAGYGKGALIAAFTSFDEASKKQSQSIAFSHDGGITYQYYDLNPVLDIWSTEFRDPTVIWDDNNRRWVMLVAKALEKKVTFYSSPDLKHWTWMSDFGPMGDSERSWECPDMFQLPVEGSDEKKWVLVVSINWAREQYFTGDFDGTRFIPDHPDSEPLYIDHGLDYYASRVFQNYDRDDTPVYTIGWVNTWDYANQAPTAYGKGIWSLPRALTLYPTDNGLRMRQRPAEALESLRMRPFDMQCRLKPGITPVKAIDGMDNVYEIKADITAAPGDVTGLILCSDGEHKVTISYDAASRYITVDRTNATDAVIPKFDRMAFARVPGTSDTVNLDIFVDKSTMEIFVNGGEEVFTLLTYSPEQATGASLFSLSGGSKVNLKAWPVASIWK